jgi:hypothetical protein
VETTALRQILSLGPLAPAAARFRRAQTPSSLQDRSAMVSTRYGDVLLHWIAIIAVSGVWFYSSDPVLTLYVGGFVVVSTYLALVLLEMRRTSILISPLSSYFLWYSVGAGLSALSIAGRVAAGETLQLGGLPIHPSDLASGYVLFLIGSASFHLGVQLIRPLKKIRSPDLGNGASNGSRRYWGVLVLIWLLGVIARLSGSDTTPAGAVFGILAWASNAALCAYCLSTSRERPRISWTLVIAGCLVEFGFNLNSFSKAYIMHSFLPILWTCLYFPSYRKWLLPLGAALSVFYLTVVAPVVTTARNEGRGDAPGTHLDRLFRTYDQYSLGDTDIGSQAKTFFERQFDAIPIGFIHGEVTKYGLLGGEGLEYLGYAFIPRLLWPDKPGVTRGAWFTVYLGGASNEEDATTSTALTAIGELYWNFGMVGVIPAMILLGAAIGVLWRIAGPMPNGDPLSMLLYFATIILVIDNAQAGVMAVGIVHRLVVLGTVIGLWAAMKRRRLAVAVRRQPLTQRWRNSELRSVG